MSFEVGVLAPSSQYTLPKVNLGFILQLHLNLLNQINFKYTFRYGSKEKWTKIYKHLDKIVKQYQTMSICIELLTKFTKNTLIQDLNNHVLKMHSYNEQARGNSGQEKLLEEETFRRIRLKRNPSSST